MGNEPLGLWAFGVGFPSLLFRFCAHATLGIYAESSEKVWNLLKGGYIPQIPPYNPNVMRSAQMAQKWSAIGFIWNFTIWFPMAFFPNILVMATGGFDLFLAVQFAIIAAMQASWIPRKEGQCASVAETWQVPNDDTASIFELVGSFNETTIPAEDVCKDFVKSWNHGVASLVLYCLTAFCNVIVGLAVCFIVSKRRYKHNNVPHWYMNLLSPIWIIPLLIFKIVLSIFDLLISIMPFKLPNVIRFPIRYASKATQVLFSPIWRKRKRVFDASKEIKLYVLEKKGKGTKDIDITTIKSERLLRILHFDTLSLISQYLHYSDVVNFSLASKAVRELTFPASELANRQLLFRKYTCQSNRKESCFVCERQICALCATTYQFGTYIIYRLHRDKCKPRCTKCYIKWSEKRMLLLTCLCSIRGNYRSVVVGSERTVCSTCALDSPQVNTERCEKLERLRLAADNKKIAHCGVCKDIIPWWSPKWWVCTKCGKDCWSSVHPPWS